MDISKHSESGVKSFMIMVGAFIIAEIIGSIIQAAILHFLGFVSKKDKPVK